jgi:hypothetical protein
MIAEMSAVLGTVKTSVELLKTQNNVSKDEKVRSAVFDLQSQMLSLQEKMFEANARYEEQAEWIKELQKELDSKNRWEEAAKKYEVYHPAHGITFYRLKHEHNVSGSEIWACPNCFSDQKISILNKPGFDFLNYKCHACGFDVIPFPGY